MSATPSSSGMDLDERPLSEQTTIYKKLYIQGKREMEAAQCAHAEQRREAEGVRQAYEQQEEELRQLRQAGRTTVKP